MASRQRIQVKQEKKVETCCRKVGGVVTTKGDYTRFFVQLECLRAARKRRPTAAQVLLLLLLLLLLLFLLLLLLLLLVRWSQPCCS